MKTIKRFFALLGVSVVVALSGCAGPEPYIYGTLDRAVNDGTKSVEIADQVMVCYNAEWANPKDVIGLAVKECGKTKRKAKFVKHDFLACPVLLPARAYFSCVGSPMLQTKSSLIDTKRHQWPGIKNAVKPAEEVTPVAKPELPPELPSYLRK
jgi:hypothetical protein